MKSQRPKLKPVPTSETKNPWTTLSIRDVHSNPWIHVTDRKVLMPNGKPGRYGVVHFKNIAVGVLTLDADENVLLVGQWRYALGQYSWEIPEGGCPEGTSPRKTAHRELREETGFRARSLKHLLTLHLSNSCTDERAEIFIARDLKPGRATPEDSEELKTKWVSFATALKMVRDGRITDAIAVAALLRYALQNQQKPQQKPQRKPQRHSHRPRAKS